MKKITMLIGNPQCDFCMRLSFEEMLMQDKVEDVNRKLHVKRAAAHYGAIIHTYITDNHKRIVEKHSGTFKIKYCPCCGTKFRRG